MHPDDHNIEDLPGQGTHPSLPAEADLERRPDNVGQSGRWRHKETEKTSPRYGHEEAATRRIRGCQLQVVTQGLKAIRLNGRLTSTSAGGIPTLLRMERKMAKAANAQELAAAFEKHRDQTEGQVWTTTSRRRRSSGIACRGASGGASRDHPRATIASTMSA